MLPLYTISTQNHYAFLPKTNPVLKVLETGLKPALFL